MNYIIKQFNRSRSQGYALILTFFVLWELISRLNMVDTNYLPPVTVIAGNVYRLVASFEIIHHLTVTLKRVMLGYLLGGGVGYFLGFLCGYFPRIYSLLELSIEYLRPMPSIALIPIGILFLGLGDLLNIVIIGWACSWPVFINTMDGVRSTDAVLLNTARTFGLDRLQIIMKVIIPFSVPFAFTGLRIGLGIAIAVVIITEMVASGNGLGFFIMNTSISFRVPEMYAAIIVVGFLGYILNRFFLWIDRHVLSWHKGLFCQLD